MDILALLTAQRDRLNRAIEALGGAAPKRRGVPPGRRGPGRPPAGRKKPHMSPAARRRQSARMKAYWAAKRKGAK
jgi:hypothetical protein